MLEYRKIFLSVARGFFVSLAVIITLGFLAWEINGLISLKQGEKVWIYSPVKREAEEYNPVLAADGKFETIESTQSIDAEDARPLIIKKYLEKYKSPLVPYSDLIVELSDTYEFDYRWIVAIAQQESNLCKKIPEGSHNCWGYGIHKKGTLGFDNYELALKSYAEYLKRVYFDKGLDTPELIMKKYCPSSNGSWAYGVSKFMNDLETGNF